MSKSWGKWKKHRRGGICACFLMGVGLNIKGQSSWAIAIGGPSGDMGYSITETASGDFIVAGWTFSYGAGSSDVYVIKINSNSGVVWSKTIGGTGAERGMSVIATHNGYYVIAGWTDSYGKGGSDVYLIKMDTGGNVLWMRTYGGSGNDWANSVAEAYDGGFIITGGTTSFGVGGMDVYVIKTDGEGNLQWSRAIGGMDNEEGMSVVVTSDGGFAVGGYTLSAGAGSSDAYVIRMDSHGNVLWTRTIGGQYAEGGASILQTVDGGFVITEGSYSYGASPPLHHDVYIVKLDSTGALVWTRTIGTVDDDHASSITQLSDGSLVAVGHIMPGGGYDDIYLVRVSANGTPMWTRIIGGPNEDIAHCVKATHDGGLIIAGHTRSFGNGSTDVFIVKTDSTGNVGNGLCLSVSHGGTVDSGGTINSGGVITFPLTEIDTGGMAGGGGTLHLICPIDGQEQISTPGSECNVTDESNFLLKCRSPIIQIQIFSIEGRILYELTPFSPAVELPHFINKNELMLMKVNTQNGYEFLRVGPVEIMGLQESYER